MRRTAILLIALLGHLSLFADSQSDSIRAQLPQLEGEGLANAYVDLYLYYYAQGEIDSALTTLDDLIAFRQKQGDIEKEGNARWSRVAVLNNSARFAELAVEAERQMEWFKSHGIWERYYQVWQRKCSALHDMDKVQTSLREAQLMREDALKRGNSTGSAMAYKQMGIIYYDVHQYEQADEAFRQSISLLLQHNDSSGVASGLYDFRCKALDMKKDYQQELAVSDEWLDYLAVVVKKHGEKMTSGPYCSAYLTRATALLGLGRLDEADQNLAKAETYNDLYPTALAAYYICCLRADLALARDDVAQAQAYVDSLSNMNETFDDKVSMLKVKTYVRSGRAADAIGIYEKLLVEKDSIFSREMRMQLDELNTLFHVDELKMQNSLERSRYLLGIAVLALLVVLALMLYFYSRYRAGKRLEREHQLLLESNEKLERGYEELQAANARAEESQRMKAEFIKNISHEIRTPLNILNGFTQIVAMPGVTLSEEEMVNAQKEISENSNRITRLVNKMLELSEASSTLTIERTDDASVEQIAATAADMAMVERAGGPVAFEMHIPDGVGQTMLRTNLHYASRVLELLLGNAMKFTHEGRVTLSAALTSDGRQVAFAVEDTGIGIPPEEAEHIFQEFVQLDSFADGTGIGLTVARTMARRMNGDLTLDTTYTGGARFVFTLPA
ncbi:MAG: hypothetical protein IJ588_10965 [Prevotella sp.]|nr:hypothetical protein [Prevotella sp.]